MSTPTDEPITPLRIGAGSFASIFVVCGGPLAFKIVHARENREILKKEYEALSYLYAACNTDSFFRVPKPLAFYDAEQEVLLATTHRPFLSRNSRIAHCPPAPISASFFEVLGNSDPVYAMDRVFALPGNVGRPICSQFMPDAITTSPNLCRLYFGKTFDQGKGSRFVNTNNFPLDVQRYQWLRATLSEEIQVHLPSAEEIALEMGEMLGRIHWHGGYDARDVEFIMGGDGFVGVTFYVIDFNQMRPWGRSYEDVSVLVDAFFQNDPYYPRPRDGGSMYRGFREGYLLAYPPTENSRVIAEAFLTAIEEKDGIVR
ncbi:hypothetical protein FN846DRAFT_931516 [Sphaerosporella brunnea]|uniref:DUF3669 domain-containing protein n=1 Tax=Sphaerosporella brunnea TaxID=1250544 RepID=A0A5J5F868_9PEZI|nr:hypothetical protein FN846DRAFT_931516 [Sphaerosporella brunnea]